METMMGYRTTELHRHLFIREQREEDRQRGLREQDRDIYMTLDDRRRHERTAEATAAILDEPENRRTLGAGAVARRTPPTLQEAVVAVRTP